MVITLDLTSENLKNFKVLLDIVYDNMYKLSVPEFKEILDKINKAVDEEIQKKKEDVVKTDVSGS
jgi:hypothetical protein